MAVSELLPSQQPSLRESKSGEKLWKKEWLGRESAMILGEEVWGPWVVMALLSVCSNVKSAMSSPGRCRGSPYSSSAGEACISVDGGQAVQFLKGQRAALVDVYI